MLLREEGDGERAGEQRAVALRSGEAPSEVELVERFIAHNPHCAGNEFALADLLRQGREAAATRSEAASPAFPCHVCGVPIVALEPYQLDAPGLRRHERCAAPDGDTVATWMGRRIEELKTELAAAKRGIEGMAKALHGRATAEAPPSRDRELLQRLVNFVRHDQCDPRPDADACLCCRDYLSVAEHIATQAGGIPDTAQRREACEACQMGVWCEQHPVLVSRRERANPETSETARKGTANAIEDSGERDRSLRRGTGVPGDGVEPSRDQAAVRAVGVAHEGRGRGLGEGPDGTAPSREPGMTDGAAEPDSAARNAGLDILGGKTTAERVADIRARQRGEPPYHCKVPPPGWSCSRGEGHEGPCAASPTATPSSGEAEEIVRVLATADLTDWGVCSVLKLRASRFTSAKERA